MKTPVMTEKRKSFLFALLFFGCFFACFILAPLGGFVVWIFGGATAYFLFMSIYALIPAEKKQFTRQRFDPKAEEMKNYIRFHGRMLAGLFLGALLFVVVFLMMIL